MRTIILIPIFFLVQFTCLAQNWERYDHKIDSLKKLVNSSKDSLRAKAILEYGGILVNKAWNATNQGEFALAFETYGTAFELFENPETANFFKSLIESLKYEKRYWKQLANINFNYGLLMSATENREERLRYHRTTYDIAAKQNDILHLVYFNGGMAMLHLQESNSDSALAAVERALSYDPELYDYASYPMLLYFNGEANLNLGKYQIAKNSFISGIEYANRDKSNIHLVINCLGLSKAYTELNVKDSSYFYGQKAINLLKEIKEIQMLKIDLASAYETMFKHFQKFQQQDSAFKYLQLASDQRAIFSQKTIKNLAAFQQVLLEKQIQLKDLEKKQIEMQAQNRTYLFVAAFFIFIVIGSTLLISNRQKQKANALLFQQKEEIQSAMSSLKSAQDQLVQQEKLASLGQLTAGIAHEIKNPLNFVNNFSEVSLELIEEVMEELKAQGLAPHQTITEILNDIESNLRKIYDHGSRANSIVTSMLQHSRGGTGKKEPEDLNTLVKEYVNLCFHGMRAAKNPINVSISLDLDPDIQEVSLIHEDFTRVIINLCNNAFDAMRQKKLLNPEDYQPKLSVRTKSERDCIVLEVEDNGPGIPDDIKDKILQPFFTTKKGTEGTGLGLSITHDIVKAHGGELKLESQEGEGTAFIIKLSKNG